MNDVGGSESGRGLRAVKSSRTSDSNFEYDDSEWDVGIGNLIIDLDADIEKTNEATRSSSNSSAPSLQTLGRSLPNSQMHIPPSSTSSSTSVNSSSKGKSSSSVPLPGTSCTISKTSTSSSSETTTSGTSGISISMEHTTMSDKGLKMKIKRSKPGTKSVDAKHEIVKSDVIVHASGSNSPTTSLSKNSSSNNSEPKSSSSASSQKDGKEAKSEKEVGSDGTGNLSDSNSVKVKAAKRLPTSTHKKVKLASGVTASIVSTTKKDASSSDAKSASSANVIPISLSHGKDGFNSNQISVTNLGATSAFVKTSASSNIKIPNQGSVLGNDMGGVTPSVGNTTNCRSLHNSTSHSSSTPPHAQSNSSSPVKSDKSGMSPSLNTAPSEKGLGSNSSIPFGKKARASSYPAEKNSNLHDGLAGGGTNSQNHGTMVSSSHGYRSIATSSGNDAATVGLAGAQLAGSFTSSGTTVKDCGTVMNSRIPVQQHISFQDACVGTTVGRGTVTEPDCLGPCEPGTSVTLEGIVWHETESGVLVVNVTWRGKTYVGTLLDCTKNDWASPRFCDSPTSDLEMRTPKNRGKRGRAQTATPVLDPGLLDIAKASSAKLRNGAKGRRGATSTAFVAPVSPLKPETWPKRKTRGSENESQEESSTTTKTTKRMKLNKESGRQAGSPAPSGSAETPGPFSPALIECPEPNCSKKYKHINGLRYHQSHAHSNSFVAEDSDSNLSTASNNNLNNVAESAGATDELLGESRIDVDAIEASGNESNSAPTTPIKKQIARMEVEEKDKGEEVSGDSELKTSRDSELKNAVTTKLMTAITAKEETEKGLEKNEIQGSKEKELPPMTGISSRPPILTVPTPFMSLQNRNQIQSSHRPQIPNSEPPEKSNRDQEGNGMLKTGTSSVSSSKGISWQPHAISPFHFNAITTTPTQQQKHNIPVTLNVPMGSSITSREHDKGSKISGSTSSSSPSKKQKHKKKSKDKNEKDRDRDRDGKSKSSHDYISRDTIKPGLFSPTSSTITSSSQKEKEREERRGVKPGGETSPRREADVGGIHAGENRDDPQSPAYSDISDANDSGPESDMNLSGKDQSGKHTVGELKKDGTGGQNLSSFYSPFYTPMESPYLGSSNPVGQVKSDRNSGGPVSGLSGGPPHDDSGAEKLKPKSSTTLPQHMSGHMEDRRSSPKLDYHHQKYLSSQHPQHYFPYPYPNYHFDQTYGNVLPENLYSHNSRSIIEEKERETEEQRIRLNSKTRVSSDCVKEELGMPTNLSSSTIKQEPGLERGSSHRSSGIDDKGPSHLTDPKSDFLGEYQESKRHGASGISQYTHSNKHSKESRREREERHGKDGESKDAVKISCRSSSQDHSSRLKGMDSSDRSSEKESKNEGAKPTMETQGPPPPPTAGSYAYYPPGGFLQGNPYQLPFDHNHHIFRQVMVQGPYPGSPYMHPHPGGLPRFSQPSSVTPLPEDLSRSNPSAPPPKALDILQHHAAQYYASQNHKIHELQERALKSPSPQVNPIRESSVSSLSGPTNLSSTPASPSPSQVRGNLNSGSSSTERKQPTDLTKEVKPSLIPLSGSGAGSESSRSPPIHHVHTHMHSHTHIAYPIPIPTATPQYSPHYGVLTTPPAAPPASVIPPFTSQKPS